MSDPVIIVGAGLAGWSTARELRKLDTGAPIMLLSQDSADFYAKPSLSNALAQGKAPQQLVNTPAAEMAQKLQVHLLPQTRVLGIDTAARRIRSTQGEHTYRDLVLATGAQPIRVPVQGDAADTVLSVNSLDDFRVFHGRLQPGSRVLILGAGLIGCEFANDLSLAGHTVQVVDPGARALATLVPEGASAALQDALGAIGVRWHFGTTLRSLQHAAAALRAELVSGETLDVDLVLSAVGLRADTALAVQAGLAVDRGVLVNAALQTSALHVYALGDSAQYASAGNRTLPFVMPIMNAAKALGATLAGQTTPLVFPVMPVAVKTPALPLVIAPPAPGTPGQWAQVEPGWWQFGLPGALTGGFALAGKQTARRAEQAKLLAA